MNKELSKAAKLLKNLRTRHRLAFISVAGVDPESMEAHTHTLNQIDGVLGDPIKLRQFYAFVSRALGPAAVDLLARESAVVRARRTRRPRSKKGVPS